LLLPHTGREAGVLAERICRTAAAKLQSEEGPLTISTGFAVFPGNGRTTADLFAAAQNALCEAHDQGGNRAMRAEPLNAGKGQAQPATG
jgi:GGDEF domain-containing protein